MRLTDAQKTQVEHCFNPRICKRCDCKPALKTRPLLVSIHASVKDATYEATSINEAGHVSIHASVKDATLVPVPVAALLCFNPRICKRCDTWFRYRWRCYYVSIHASVKDATRRAYPKPIKINSFNPRICKRCDLIPSPSSYLKSKVSIHASVKDATVSGLSVTPSDIVSIHASVKDATISASVVNVG